MGEHPEHEPDGHNAFNERRIEPETPATEPADQASV